MKGINVEAINILKENKYKIYEVLMKCGDKISVNSKTIAYNNGVFTLKGKQYNEEDILEVTALPFFID